MSYEQTPFKKIFESVVRATGLPISVIATLSADQQETFAELINDALKLFWRRPGQDFWPGTFAVEQRTLDVDGRFVLKKTDGETEIGAIDPEECFFEELPNPGSIYGVLGMVEDRGDRIVCFDDDCPDEPYIRFQFPCPKFTRVAYAAGTTYAKDELRYDSTTGECYKSVQAANLGNSVTDADWWTQIEFPDMAKVYVKWAASAEHMAEDDGKYKQAARAQRELNELGETLLPPRGVGR